MPKTFLRASVGEKIGFCKKKKEKRILGMDLYLLLRICMDLNGLLWISMDISLFHF